MATRGRTPKIATIDPRNGARVRYEPSPPTDPWPVPEGVWGPRARLWWERMASSPSASTWDSPADRDQLERGLAFVDAFWTAQEAGQVTAMCRLEALLQHVECNLWLNRSERAKQGIQADMAPKAGPVVSGSVSVRDRLRSAVA